MSGFTFTSAPLPSGGGGGQVDSVGAAEGLTVNAVDPVNPVVLLGANNPAEDIFTDAIRYFPHAGGTAFMFPDTGASGTFGLVGVNGVAAGTADGFNASLSPGWLHIDRSDIQQQADLFGAALTLLDNAVSNQLTVSANEAGGGFPEVNLRAQTNDAHSVLGVDLLQLAQFESLGLDNHLRAQLLTGVDLERRQGGNDVLVQYAAHYSFPDPGTLNPTDAWVKTGMTPTNFTPLSQFPATSFDGAFSFVMGGVTGEAVAPVDPGLFVAVQEPMGDPAFPTAGINFGWTNADTPVIGQHDYRQWARLGPDPVTSLAGLTVRGSVQTVSPNSAADPSVLGGRWQLGSRVFAATTFDATQYLEVAIDGELFYLALVTI